MINFGNNPISEIRFGNQEISSVYLGSQLLWENTPSLNFMPTNIDEYEVGCWIASGPATGNNTGSALFRVRPVQGIIRVPAGSKLLLRTNSPWIFVCRIVDDSGVITRNPAQMHSTNTPEGEIIQLEPNESGLLLSLSSLPQVESGTTFNVWANRFADGSVYPEVLVLEQPSVPTWRFIRIQWAVDGNIALNEIQAFVGTTNVASGSTITSNPAMIGNSALLIDGNLVSWAQITHWARPILTMELQQDHPLTHIVIHRNTTDGGNITVEVSTDGVTWVGTSGDGAGNTPRFDII